MSTLQDKIDAIIEEFITGNPEWALQDAINKAIQKLREEITEYKVQCLRLRNNPETKAMADAYENVLSLIGEKK